MSMVSETKNAHRTQQGRVDKLAESND